MCGTFMTSLEMAGVSISLMKANQEMLRLFGECADILPVMCWPPTRTFSAFKGKKGYLYHDDRIWFQILSQITDIPNEWCVVSMQHILLHAWYEVKKHILKGLSIPSTCWIRTESRKTSAYVKRPLLSMQMQRQVPLSGQISAPHVSAGTATSPSLKPQGPSCRMTHPLKV